MYRLFFIIVFTLQINAQSFQEQLTDYLNNQFYGYDQIKFDILSSLDEANTEIDLSRDITSKGNISYIPVRVLKNNKHTNSVLSVKVEKYKLVYSASTDIPKKQKINFDALFSRVENVAEINGTPLTSLNQEKIFRAKKFIKKGEIILQESIQDVPVIKIGDKILAEAVKGSVSVSVSAKARQDGSIGDTIEILTAENDLLKARVLNNNKVIIE